MKELYEEYVNRYTKVKALEAELTTQKRILESTKLDVIEQMERFGTQSFKGNLGMISLSRTEIPAVEDWSEVYQFIKDNDAFDLLERRMAKRAWKDRVDEGIEIPGVHPFERVTLRFTKPK